MTPSTPQTETLPVSKLTVDGDVQRSVNHARVERILKDFNPAALGVIVVSARDDGTHHIIDGQHRAAAVRALGDEEAPMTCLVYHGLTRADEAAMFRRLNNTQVVQPLDKFRVRVVEGEPVAVRLNQILNQHGWHLGTNKDDGCFASVAALDKVQGGKLNGPGDTYEICDTLIQVITKAWGHNADGMRREIVEGVGALLLRYNTRVDLPKLVDQLAGYSGGPLGLVGSARGLKNFRGGTLPDALAEVVVELVNKGRRGPSRLPEWRSAG
jgi:hypothetical protein